MGGSFSLKRREELTSLPHGWTFETMMLREADTEGHTVCDSMDGKCPKQAHSQTRRVGSWLSGARGGDGVTANGGGASFWVDGMF